MPTSDNHQNPWQLLNNSGRDWPDADQANLLSDFCKRVKNAPHRTALICNNQTLSYAQLYKKATDFAFLLLSYGVKPNCTLAIFSRKGIHQVIVVLATLMVGAAYVPLNLKWPAKRILRILQQLHEPLLVTEQDFCDLFDNSLFTFVNILIVDDGYLKKKTGNKRNGLTSNNVDPGRSVCLPEVQPDDLAYIIFTSGSTGAPKGVMMSHRAALNTLRDINRRFALSPKDRIYGISALSFDLSVWDIFGSLGAGAALVLPDEAQLMNPSDWCRQICEYRVTVWNTVPALADLMITQAAARELLSLRLALLSGDRIPPDIPVRLRRLCPDIQVIGLGGATEAAIWSSFYDITKTDSKTVIPYGRPLANQSFLVIHPQKQSLCAVGEIGELCIGGAGLAKGYLGDEAQTNAHFIELANTGDRYYRTGDLGSLSPKGYLVFVGRLDSRIKLHGHRIEPGEIEQALIQLDEVFNAVVVCRESILVAYIVPDRQFWPEVDGEKPYLSVQHRMWLVKELTQVLPSYMVPEMFVLLTALPLTVNGKVEVKALPALEKASNGRLTPASYPMEMQLCRLCQSMLHAEVGVDDNFFHLGADSLLAIRLSQQISNELNIEVPVALLFQHPTVAQLAQQLSQQKIKQVSLIKARGLNDGPMSFAQQRLWFIEQYEQGACAYHIPLLFHLSSRSAESRFVSALQKIAVRHGVLRTRFVADDQGRRLQQVGNEPLTIKHHRLVSGGLAARAFQEALINEINTPFDLSHDYPTRVVIFDAEEHRAVLLLFHHIAVDGWSVDILCRELALLCRADASELPPLGVDYLDFTLWQQEGWQQSSIDAQCQWWKQQLSGLQPLSLPLDYVRPHQFDSHAKRRQFTLSKALSKQLQRLARAEQTTLYVVMLSAFALLLGRYSGQDDVAVGSPIANRHHPQLEPLVGFFANTLVVRAFLSARQRFRELVNCVHSTVSAIQQYQDIPFEYLVEQLGVERDPSRTPLFQVMFAVQHFAPQEYWSDNEAIKPLPLPDCAVKAKFDLTLVIDDEGDRYTAVIEYPVVLFRDVTIERLWRHYVQVLTQVVADPDIDLHDVNLMTDDEYQQIVVDWNCTTQLVSGNVLLHQLFEQQCALHPSDGCLEFCGQCLSNQEVNNRANQLALTLKKTIADRLAPQTCVVVCVEPGPEVNIAALAVLKAGCVYVPVNHANAEERIGFILKQTRAPLVLTTSRFGWLLADDSPCPSLALDTYLWSDAKVTPPVLTLKADALAYIIYTSGSTGEPKGVMVSHEAAVTRIKALQHCFPMRREDVMVQKMNHGFDGSIFELFWGMLSPGMNVIAAQEVRHDPAKMLKLVDQHRVSIALFVPDALAALQFWLQQRQQLLPNSLRLIFIGGQALTAELVSGIRGVCPHDPVLVNAYGPAEAVIVSTTYLCPQGVAEGPVPIGRPLPNTQVFVMDNHGQPLPPGIAGELYIGGKALASGYLDRPEQTATAFVSNPFATAAERASGADRLYRSGDRVKWLENGVLLFLGRRDQQIKLRGFRIEPKEIERCLMTITGIRSAVVLPCARESDGGHYDYLTAWYIPEKTAVDSTHAVEPMDENYLREVVSQKLPNYMIPDVYVAVDHFPLTANEKLNIKALPQPKLPIKDYVAPTNAMQSLLCRLWQSLLSVGRVGIHDNFFHLGGDSLLAIHLCQLISNEFAVEVPVALLFQYPTVANLAPQLKNEVSSILARGLEDGPMSFAQQRLWFIAQYEYGASAYHVPLLFQPKNTVIAKRFIAALQQLVVRHSILRTHFFMNAQGQRLQQVGQQPLAVDRRRLPPDALEQALVLAIKTPFDLSRDNPVRAAWFDTGERQVILFLFHHIAVDGWSVEILCEELAMLCRTDTPTELTPLTIDYLDFTLWQQGEWQQRMIDTQRQWWQQQLAGLEPLNLPLDFPRPHQFDYRGSRCHFTLSSALSAQLKQLARTEQTTLYVVMLSAFTLLLGRYSGQDDVAVGSPMANRNHPQLEPLVGFFANTLVVRTVLDSQQRFQELLARVHGTVSEMQRYQDIPFEQLVEQLDVERDPSRMPLFQVMFAVQHFNLMEHWDGQNGLQAKPLPIPDAAITANFDLTLIVDDQGEILTATVIYPVALFRAATIERLWRHYV